MSLTDYNCYDNILMISSTEQSIHKMYIGHYELDPQIKHI
jgi:hypothetical protein